MAALNLSLKIILAGMFSFSRAFVTICLIFFLSLIYFLNRMPGFPFIFVISIDRVRVSVLFSWFAMLFSRL